MGLVLLKYYYLSITLRHNQKFAFGSWSMLWAILNCLVTQCIPGIDQDGNLIAGQRDMEGQGGETRASGFQWVISRTGNSYARDSCANPVSIDVGKCMRKTMRKEKQDKGKQRMTQQTLDPTMGMQAQELGAAGPSSAGQGQVHTAGYSGYGS